MARYICQGVYRDGNGRVIVSGTVSVYLAGTTTAASVYTASAGGVAVNSVTSSATDGSWKFYVDELDYAVTQKFKLLMSKTNYTTATYDDIAIFPEKGASPSNKVAAYTITANDEIVFCDGTFTVTLPDGSLTYEEAIANVGTGTITVVVDNTATDTIEGSTTIILSGQYNSIQVKCDGNGLWVRF